MKILIKKAVVREPGWLYYIDWKGNLCACEVVIRPYQCHGLTRDGTRCLNKGLPEFCRKHECHSFKPKPKIRALPAGDLRYAQKCPECGLRQKNKDCLRCGFVR